MHVTTASGTVHATRTSGTRARLRLSGISILACTGRAVSLAVPTSDPVTCKACLKRIARDGGEANDVRRQLHANIDAAVAARDAALAAADEATEKAYALSAAVRRLETQLAELRS